MGLGVNKDQSIRRIYWYQMTLAYLASQFTLATVVDDLVQIHIVQLNVVEKVIELVNLLLCFTNTQVLLLFVHETNQHQRIVSC